MQLVTFGVGYVGLVTGTGMSELGHHVLCVDINAERIRLLEQGVLPIYEPGLADLVRRNVQSGRLQFATELSSPFDEADVYFIGVGTPEQPDGTADVSAVFAVGERIAQVARKPALVCVKSTVPVGTCDALQARLRKAKVELEVVSNPEFLKEGDAVNDFFKPDRVLLGVQSERAQKAMRALYAPLQFLGERLVVTDLRSSELIKYASNAMLAVRVSFMNELARLCHATGANIHAVRLGIGSDSRIGKRFLYAGPGYGGSCFPKDVKALAALGQGCGVSMRLAQATDQANEEQAVFVAKLVHEALGGLAGKRVALWGLAFKPETDDVRESPALKLSRTLLAEGATVVGHDPEAGPNFAKAINGQVIVKARDYEALNEAHALVLLTEWRSYRAPDFAEIRQRLHASSAGISPAVIDTRNIWKPEEVTQAGLRYYGIGVPAVSAVQS